MVEAQDIEAIALNLANIYEKLKGKEFFLSMTGDALSYTATKIASLKALLVDVKREAERAAKDADTEYKRTKGVAFQRLTASGTSATAAAQLLYAEHDVVDASTALNTAEAQWNFVKSLTADGHDMVESLRSRLIDLQSSRKDESHG